MNLNRRVSRQAIIAAIAVSAAHFAPVTAQATPITLTQSHEAGQSFSGVRAGARFEQSLRRAAQLNEADDASGSTAGSDSAAGAGESDPAAGAAGGPTVAGKAPPNPATAPMTPTVDGATAIVPLAPGATAGATGQGGGSNGETAADDPIVELLQNGDDSDPVGAGGSSTGLLGANGSGTVTAGSRGTPAGGNGPVTVLLDPPMTAPAEHAGQATAQQVVAVPVPATALLWLAALAGAALARRITR